MVDWLVKVDQWRLMVCFFWSKGRTWWKGLEIWMLLAFMLLNHHRHTLNVASMYLNVFAFKFQAICSCTILVWCQFLHTVLLKSNHLNSELGSSSSAASQFLFSPCRFKAFKARRLTGAKVNGVRIPSCWGTRLVKLRILGSKAFCWLKKKKVAHWWNEQLLWSLSFLLFFLGGNEHFMNFVAS